MKESIYGTIRIGDVPAEKCTHPQHNVAPMQVFKNGVYIHTCPKCKNSYSFTINRVF